MQRDVVAGQRVLGKGRERRLIRELEMHRNILTLGIAPQLEIAKERPKTRRVLSRAPPGRVINRPNTFFNEIEKKVFSACSSYLESPNNLLELDR